MEDKKFKEDCEIETKKEQKEVNKKQKRRKTKVIRKLIFSIIFIAMLALIAFLCIKVFGLPSCVKNVISNETSTVTDSDTDNSSEGDNSSEDVIVDTTNRIIILSVNSYSNSDGDGSTDYIVICDTQTGVCYLVVLSRTSTNQQLTVTVLVDSNGNPVINGG